jgi:hypothetical protein
MSNIYEQLLLTDKTALELKITNLVKKQLNDCDDEAKEELNQIAKVIDYSVDIDACCTHEIDSPVMSGTKNFDSVEDYLDRDHHYDYADEAAKDGIQWDSNPYEGSFSWDDYPSVSAKVLGLTEHSSDEAKNLWGQLKEQENREQELVAKRRQLERAQKYKRFNENLERELQAEIEQLELRADTPLQ